MMQRSRIVFYSAALGMLAVWLLACPAAKTAIDVGQLVGCVLSHESEPIPQIVADCEKYGAPTVQDVETILEQHRAATARERAAGVLPPCDAGDAK